MIPRKLAKRLLAEYAERLRDAHSDAVVETFEQDATGDRTAVLDQVAADLLAASDLVLRGSENVEQKARRYLTEGRITVEKVTPAGLIVASARGSASELYHLGYDPAKKEWRCTCPVVGKRHRCSHLAALQLVTARPS